MSNVAQLHKAETPDLRAGLRRAIAQHKEAQERLATHRAALDRAHDLIRDREAELETARQHTLGAKNLDAQAIAAAIKGGTSAITDNVRRSRAVEIDCEDAVELARGAAAELAKEENVLMEAAHTASKRVGAEVSAVMAPHIAALCDEIEEAKEKILKTSHKISAFIDESPGARLDERWPGEIFSLRQRAIKYASDTAEHSEWKTLGLSALRDKAKEIRARLGTDADTPLDV